MKEVVGNGYATLVEVCEAKVDWGTLPNTAQIRQDGYAAVTETLGVLRSPSLTQRSSEAQF